jgi:hypothetical protein
MAGTKFTCVIDSGDYMQLDAAASGYLHVFMVEDDRQRIVVLDTEEAQSIVDYLNNNSDDAYVALKCAVNPNDDLIVQNVGDGETGKFRFKVSQPGKGKDTNVYLNSSSVPSLTDAIAQYVPSVTKPTEPTEIVDAFVAEPAGLRKNFSCQFTSDDQLSVRYDDRYVTLRTTGDDTVFLRGEQVLELIVHLIKYTNTSTEFDGALELTRKRAKVEEIEEQIVTTELVSGKTIE